MAKTSHADPDTPLSMPRPMGKSARRTVEETPHQSPSPADGIQARILARRKATKESRRLIREREHALEKERRENLTRGWLDDDDPSCLSMTKQKDTMGMPFNQLYGREGRIEAKVPRFAVGLRARAYDDDDAGLRLRDAMKTDYVPPPNFGHRPGESWLARREWQSFLRRREEKWGDPEEVGGEEVTVGGGGGDEEVETY